MSDIVSADECDDLAPLDDLAWPESIDRLKSGFAGSLNIYRIMAHNPALLAAWENLRNHVVKGNSLSARLQEIVILRTGFKWGSAYEWAHHVHRGKAAGLTDAEIAAAGASDPGAAPCDPALAMFIAAVDQLLQKGRLDQPLRSELVGRIGAEGVLDLFATVGMYTTLAFIANSFKPPIDDGLVARPFPSMA